MLPYYTQRLIHTNQLIDFLALFCLPILSPIMLSLVLAMCVNAVSVELTPVEAELVPIDK